MKKKTTAQAKINSKKRASTKMSDNIIQDKSNTAKPLIAIVYRSATPNALTLAKTLTARLHESGHTVFTAPEQKKLPGTKLASKKQLGQMKLILVLGGDGTYLRAVRLLGDARVPILGVNLGSLGFLTPTRSEEVFTAVDSALAQRMKSVPRSMIHVEVFRKGTLKLKSIALNDVVIERGSLSQLINIAIYSDKHLVSELKSDGIIVASPTGSTAYNLAAGGPILHPEVKAFVVTPISPHSLTSRPMIMPDHGTLSFKMVGKLQKAHFVVDGQKLADVDNEDEIFITRNLTDHLMVSDPDFNYFHLLREKLKFGDRA